MIFITRTYFEADVYNETKRPLLACYKRVLINIVWLRHFDMI